MPEHPCPPISPARRRFLVRTIAAIHGAMGATLTFILGGAILAPSFQLRAQSWLRAAPLDAIPDEEPLPVTLRVARHDGLTQVVDKRIASLRSRFPLCAWCATRLPAKAGRAVLTCRASARGGTPRRFAT